MLCLAGCVNANTNDDSLNYATSSAGLSFPLYWTTEAGAEEVGFAYDDLDACEERLSARSNMTSADEGEFDIMTKAFAGERRKNRILYISGGLLIAGITTYAIGGDNSTVKTIGLGLGGAGAAGFIISAAF